MYVSSVGVLVLASVAFSVMVTMVGCCEVMVSYRANGSKTQLQTSGRMGCGGGVNRMRQGQVYLTAVIQLDVVRRRSGWRSIGNCESYEEKRVNGTKDVGGSSWIVTVVTVFLL